MFHVWLPGLTMRQCDIMRHNATWGPGVGRNCWVPRYLVGLVGLVGLLLLAWVGDWGGFWGVSGVVVYVAVSGRECCDALS